MIRGGDKLLEIYRRGVCLLGSKWNRKGGGGWKATEKGRGGRTGEVCTHVDGMHGGKSRSRNNGGRCHSWCGMKPRLGELQGEGTSSQRWGFEPGGGNKLWLKEKT